MNSLTVFLEDGDSVNRAIDTFQHAMLKNRNHSKSQHIESRFVIGICGVCRSDVQTKCPNSLFVAKKMMLGSLAKQGPKSTTKHGKESKTSKSLTSMKHVVHTSRTERHNKDVSKRSSATSTEYGVVYLSGIQPSPKLTSLLSLTKETTK